MDPADGKGYIMSKQTRSCGCLGGSPPPDGWCWEGVMDPISDYQTCRNMCLCKKNNASECQCKKSTQNVRQSRRPVTGAQFCQAEPLLKNCNKDGVCTPMSPSDPNHPQRTGDLGYAVGSYNCPDMWPTVQVNPGETVTATARCGCGYKGTQSRTCRAAACPSQGAAGPAATWGEADRTGCVKIDWVPGCDKDGWSGCQLSNPGASCGAGIQKCRRACTTGMTEDCVGAARAGCIDPTNVLTKTCNIPAPRWTQWGPWGWVRPDQSGKPQFFVGYDPAKPTCGLPEATGMASPQCSDLQAIHYDNEDAVGFAKRCGSYRQKRFYQCSTSRKACTQACRDSCYVGEPSQEGICRNNVEVSQPKKGKPCRCEELDQEAVHCPGGFCEGDELTINIKKQQL